MNFLLNSFDFASVFDAPLPIFLICCGVLFLLASCGLHLQWIKPSQENLKPYAIALLIFFGIAFSTSGVVLGMSEEDESISTRTPDPTVISKPERTPAMLPTSPLAKIATSMPTSTILPTRTHYVLVEPDLGARERVNFPLGSSSFQVTRFLENGRSHGFVLGVAAYQTINVQTSKPIDIGILDPSGKWLLLDQINSTHWRAPVHNNGDYVVVVQGVGEVTFFIEIPPLGE